MNVLQSKPLLNIGMDLNWPVVEEKENIPTLETNATAIGQTKEATIYRPMEVSNTHKVLFYLMKVGKAAHRDQIASALGLPVSTISATTQYLSKDNLILSHQRGYWHINSNPIRKFEIAKGFAKTEILLKMCEEAGIDPHQYDNQTHSVEQQQEETKDTMASLLSVITKQKERIKTIDQTISQLQSEKDAIREELRNLGKMLTEE